MIREYNKEVKSVTLLDANGNEVFIYKPASKIFSIKAFKDDSIIQMHNGDSYIIECPTEELIKFING